MGHRDDFYVRANIIGITGPVNELPTVYFQSAAGEYGHITQVHAYNFNWGRTQVEADPGWQITNICPAQCGCGLVTSHEIDGQGEVIHRSRSQFRTLATLTADEQNVAAQAIYRCPYAKTDPLYDQAYAQAGEQAVEQARDDEEDRFQNLWAERHQRGPLGRRGTIDYTADGLANNLLKIAYKARAT
jgi:hypothetical protein